jgi:hypothetical protein
MKILHGSLLLISFCCATVLWAQEPKIETDRPGETQNVELVKKGYVQAETGFRKEQQNYQDYALLHPQLQLRFGLSERFELRAEINAETEKTISKNEFKYGLQPVELGLKTKLTEQKGALPATAFYLQAGIPKWASPDHQKEHVFPKLRFLFENKLTDKLSLSYNGGAEWQGDGKSPRYLYTIQPELELDDHWDVFVETFAYLQRGQAAEHYIDGGFVFYPHRNIKLDLWGGKGVTKEANDYFVSAGISFRFR